VELDTLQTASKKTAILVVLKDWRIWVIALCLQLAAGLISGLMGWDMANVAAGSSALIGMIVAMRLGSVRGCPKCSEHACFKLTPDG